MRVISGSLRGRTLQAPKGLSTRPTADRVKEAIASSLQFSFEGARVLDLFAGSGQMAIEALSRGAAYAVLVDSDPAAAACAEENLRACALTSRAEVLRRDALAYLAQNPGPRFDIAFLDPPYRKNLLREALPLLVPCMRPDGVIVCEHEPEWDALQSCGAFRREKVKTYGKIAVSFYTAGKERTDAERTNRGLPGQL